jgi:NADP-dependent 3-hydroxy acid dehydrogenase YdfG
MRKLEGKIALIPGASCGIGCSVAHAFAREGARLFLVERGFSPKSCVIT